MKKRKKFIWRLFFSYIFIAIGALLAAGWYFFHSLDAFLHDLVVVELSERARLLQNQILPHLEPPDPGAVDAICKQSGKASETRFTVVLPSGAVIGDTWVTPQNMDNHAGRPEIAGALDNGKATAKRFSNTLQQNIVYVAIAVLKTGPPIGVVRASIPLARTFSRANAASGACTSTPQTRTPGRRNASRMGMMPQPVPRSTTVSPGRGSRLPARMTASMEKR